MNALCSLGLVGGMYMYASTLQTINAQWLVGQGLILPHVYVRWMVASWYHTVPGLHPAQDQSGSSARRDAYNFFFHLGLLGGICTYGTELTTCFATLDCDYRSVDVVGATGVARDPFAAR